MTPAYKALHEREKVFADAWRKAMDRCSDLERNMELLQSCECSTCNREILDLRDQIDQLEELNSAFRSMLLTVVPESLVEGIESEYGYTPRSDDDESD